MKMKKFLIGLGLVFILAVTLEVGVFNFGYWREKTNTTTMKNIAYNLDQMEKVNWIKTPKGWVSKGDQHLILKDVNTQINTMQIKIQVEKEPDYVLLFYKEDGMEEFSNDASILYEGETLLIGKKVTDLRFDISNQKGVVLKSINLLINPMSFHFSTSRIIAILLIYILGCALFAIQRSPDYGIKGD
jgi:hypothetical protein